MGIGSKVLTGGYIQGSIIGVGKGDTTWLYGCIAQHVALLARASKSHDSTILGWKMLKQGGVCTRFMVNSQGSFAWHIPWPSQPCPRAWSEKEGDVSVVV